MDSIITETVEFLDKNYGAQISKEEARQAIKNVTGFFQILNEWEQSSKNIERSSGKETTLKGSSKGK